MINCNVCGKELSREVGSFLFVCDDCIAAEDRRTTLHGMTREQIDSLTAWYEEYTAKLTSSGWVIGDTTWLDILRNSARQ